MYVDLKNFEKQKANITRCSQAVTHPSTDRARRCLTSVIGREPVRSAWYGRSIFATDLQRNPFELRVRREAVDILKQLLPNSGRFRLLLNKNRLLKQLLSFSSTKLMFRLNRILHPKQPSLLVTSNTTSRLTSATRDSTGNAIAETPGRPRPRAHDSAGRVHAAALKLCLIATDATRMLFADAHSTRPKQRRGVYSG
ncbi:hypothetical protein EVAR_96242_1 [Eumeta japonica]|uniref:Uncharacterized protein n=1 Tax=Eumeta variegata TaxID=151549 RepID=A0A4C1WJM7_EUMVA|nr:hypothetical protein EVAR_96242_1 [Eumeta japonica]